MKTTTLGLLILSIILPLATAQNKDALPAKLPDMIARALDTNPDIRVARAKLAEVQAELRRLELQVTRDVVSMNSARLAKLESIATVERELVRKEAMVKQGTVPLSAVSGVRMQLIEARGGLQEVEAELHYICGVGIEGRSEAQPKAKRKRSVRPPRSARMDDLMRRPATIDVKDVPFRDLMKTVSDIATFTILIDQEILEIYDDETYSLSLKGTTTVEGILTAVHDIFPECIFVLRDYGALATSIFRAQTTKAPTLPEVPTTW